MALEVVCGAFVSLILKTGGTNDGAESFQDADIGGSEGATNTVSSG